MNLAEILKTQPDGFCPPEVTVKVEKIGERKSGVGDYGEWSFQTVQALGGGTLKLKNLPEFPAARQGQTVTIRAHNSKQHGLTGLKVDSREYNGQTYRELVVTNSAKWDFGQPATNGDSAPASAPVQTELRVEKDSEVYANHILACAELARSVATSLTMVADDAVQACFATICIDTKNRGILLPKPETNGHQDAPTEAAQGQSEEFDDDIPF